MKYADAYKKAQEKGTTRNLSPTWFEFKKPGDAILGKLLSHSEVPGKLSGQSYLQYMMSTDDGLVKFALGANADRELAPVLEINGVYRVEFLSKEEIGGGKRVNKFRIESVPTEAGEGVSDEGIPF